MLIHRFRIHKASLGASATSSRCPNVKLYSLTLSPPCSNQALLRTLSHSLPCLGRCFEIPDELRDDTGAGRLFFFNCS